MSIVYHEQPKLFHLYNPELSYVIRIMENGQLENLYYGKRIHDQETLGYLHEESHHSLMTISSPEPSLLSMQHTRQEYPAFGTGDYRQPAFRILQENGSYISNFIYESYEIIQGKPEIRPLPATYVEEDSEAQTLIVTLYDEVSETQLQLSYTIYEGLPAITRNARFLQKGAQAICLDRALSMSVDFPDKDYALVHLDGAWSRERYVKTQKLESGIFSVGSMKGASSSEHNPFLALKRPHTDEFQGEVFGFSLVYSGSFLAQTEVCTYDTTRVTMGIHPDTFSWELKQGEEFQTPEAVMVYSDKGFNGMSQTYHDLYRNRLARGRWRNKPRPILLNNWEATMMDFDEEKILKIASKGKEVGVELFVLDDGWFGTRDDDYQGLGDWYVNTDKLPGGLTGLAEKIEAMGMQFGLWIEPEMINKNSQLYQEHPEWLLSVPGRFESHSRHQHVLDFSRKDVVDYIHEQISGIMRTAAISYIKWDMNRYISECYSRAAEPSQQGKVMHKYILGVYDLYDRLTSEFPDVLFESCASGGARFDPGMLYYAPQAWVSDDTDALERAKIQYGTSYVYPISSMGAHVSAVPNQQLLRETPLETRANVAYFGTFGYELDLNELTVEELELVKKQIVFMKENRTLIQSGVFYRLVNPFEAKDAAWMVVSRDQTEALAGYYQSLNKVNASLLRLRLKGLDGNMKYQMLLDGEPQGEYYGDVLMNAGVVIDRNLFNKKGGDFASCMIRLKQAD